MTKSKKPSVSKSDPFAQREAGNYENPIASRELILEHLESSETPLTHPQLVDVLSLTSDEQIEALRRRLIAMCRDGQVVEDRRRAYTPMSRIELIRGRVQGHKDGYGFLIPDEGGNDYHLNPRQMRKVFDGDMVTIRANGVDNRGKQEAVIVEIMQRNTQQLVGRFYMQGENGYVAPDNRRISQEIMIHGNDKNGAEHGQFVVVDITNQPDARNLPAGKITEVLGDHLAPGMEIDIALRSHDIPFVFPDEVEAQTAAIADEVTEQDKLNRIDLRKLPLVTIDGEDAKDFDDAVYCEYNAQSKGYTLYVAIADVSHYVGVNSPLDVEAQNRGNSVYFPEHVVPMLPEKLSNGLCSLKPHVDRLCMVCEMEIGPDGALNGYKFYEGLMHSHARLTYKLVGKILDPNPQDSTALEESQALRSEYKDVVSHLDALHGLYKTLKATRQERGAIDFETTETRIIFNSERKIEDIVPITRNDAHKLIEECMLCANVATASFFQQHKLDAIYRVHQGPSEQKLENLKQYLNELGLILQGGLKPTPKEYAHVMSQIDGRPDAHLIQTMLLRSMSQAVYQPENEGHFGLAFPAYTHFTSPIRRYPDLMVHRGIRHLIRSEKDDAALMQTIKRADDAKPIKKDDIYPYDMPALLQLGEQCSLTERRADEATRDVMDFLKCEYMRDHLGDEFDGIISSVTGFGLFVELKDLFVEGLIHVTNLQSDYYSFDPIRLRLTGERTGKIFHMGDEIRIVVSRVDLDDRKIDFQMAGVPIGNQENKGGKKPRRGGKKPSGAPGVSGDRKPVRKRRVEGDDAASDKNAKDPHAKSKAAKKEIMDGAKKASKKKKPSTRQKLNARKAAKKTAKKTSGKKKK